MVNERLAIAIESLESTPSLLIDLPTVESNVERLAIYARSYKIGIRPHTKTHKSIRMARLQIEHGAIGLTTAKVGEAETLVEASKDLLIAYPLVDPYRLRRAAKLAQHAIVRLALDTETAIDRAAAAANEANVTLGVLVDLDVGVGRTGVQSPAAALALAQRVANSPGLRLDGLFFYPGHIWLPVDQQPEALAKVEAKVAETIALFRHAGLQAPIVCGGSTPTAYQSHLIPSGTEIRPGTYLYNDINTARAGFCTLDECAARLICTVVSDAVPGKVVIDAGTKTLTSDRNVLFPDSGHGHVVEFPDAIVSRLSEEHGELDITKCANKPKVGQRVSVIPNHICPCVNLQDTIWLSDAHGQLMPSPVDTRGRLA